MRIGKPSKHCLELLKYTAQEYCEHLIKGFPEFETLREAYDNNYEVDHIVPLSFIASNIDNKDLQFKVAMDINNQQLLLKEENISKFNKTDIPIVQETIMYLNCKYNVSLPFEAYDK